MSTRGSYGVRIDGKDKLAFNHWDSYPGSLGAELVSAFQRALKEYGVEELADLARHLRLIAEDKPVTEEEYDKYCEMLDTRQEYASGMQWYALAQEVQGKLIINLRAGVMLSSPEFILDSLFCEWAYIFNFDEGVFEVYKGFQEEPHTHGRFSHMFKEYRHRNGKPDVKQFHPCALIKAYPFHEIPDDWVAQIELMTKEDE